MSQRIRGASNSTSLMSESYINMCNNYNKYVSKTHIRQTRGGGAVTTMSTPPPPFQHQKINHL